MKRLLPTILLLASFQAMAQAPVPDKLAVGGYQVQASSARSR